MIARLVTGIALGLCALAAQAQVERIDPPSWWVGMKSRQLQLMVHGPHIADYQPELHYPGVRLSKATRVENPNYLFVDLDIAPQTRPGRLSLDFRKGAERITVPYELLLRAPHSAGRRGFGNADVILNLMPDRFANGNPANDDVPGFADKANRADNDAGRHGGDIQGIVDHLDHIAAMGYTMLWPTPLTESNQPHYSYHGYAATDTYRIDPRYGSNEDYRRMVAAARERGIGVIQDIVLNHIGSNHWWMRDLPTQDWLSGGKHYVPTGHARTAISDPYAAEVDRESFIAGWFGPEMPDMNQRNPLLATYQIQNTIWWIEYAGLAGIRADTYGYSDKHFLAQWSGRVMQEYPRLNIVGEEWSNNPVVTSYWLRGKKNADGYVSNLPSVMDFPLQGTLLRALVAPEGLHSGMVDVYEAMVNDRLYPDPMNLVLFEGNHDLPRLYSMVDEDLALWKMALAFVLTAPRIPQIYVGTEILMTSPKVRDDGAFRHDFPGGWAGDKVNAFTGEGLSDRQKEAQAWLKRVLNWRKTQPAVQRGKFMHYQPQDGMYVYFRYDAKGLVMVVLNKNAGDATLATERFRQVLPRGASGTDVLTGRRYELGDTLVVPARSVLILDLKRPE